MGWPVNQAAKNSHWDLLNISSFEVVIEKQRAS